MVRNLIPFDIEKPDSSFIQIPPLSTSMSTLRRADSPSLYLAIALGGIIPISKARV